MAEPGTRARRAAERRQQIIDVARSAAEADGWAAVTSRRLADAIGYTQPVLYGHFPGGKTEIMRTVALAGFAELAAASRAAVGDTGAARAVAGDEGGGAVAGEGAGGRAVAGEGAGGRAVAGEGAGGRAVEAVAEAYLDFAAAHPALYEAMFQLPIDARFAQDDAEAELRSAFNALAAAIGDAGDGTVTEVFWSALHGMSLLERAGRMPPENRRHRVAELAARFGR